jgi:hypothetical protein
LEAQKKTAVMSARPDLQEYAKAISMLAFPVVRSQLKRSRFLAAS